MQVRVSRVSRNGRTYEYAQLVESYRRESDGMPTHRVVANLGALSATEIENLRTALAAGRAGKRVVVARTVATRPAKVALSLRYLDVAVLLELWRRWGLPEILTEVLSQGASDVCPADVVAALAIQRCVAPDSKLAATRWFPRSALPELLGIVPDAFNNTRLHRVLDDLERSEGALMARLPRRYEERDGDFVAMFLDTTDTWFVGQGPSLAKRGKTKEGMMQRKIGIALLCNQAGYPLRWEVLPGTAADAVTMPAVLRSIAGLSWAAEAPVVLDRAVGKTAQIRELLATELRFLTALTVSEFSSYAPALPHERFASFELHGEDKEQIAHDAAAALERAETAGMTKIKDDLLVKDFGLVERQVEAAHPDAPRPPATTTQMAMRHCLDIEQAVADGRHQSFAAAGRALGLQPSLSRKYRRLGQLPADVQRQILDGKAAARSLGQLLRIVDLQDAEAQRDAFDALIASSSAQVAPSSDEQRAGDKPSGDAGCTTIQVRVVAYFNPERFIHERLRAAKNLAEIETFVKELNQRLSRPHSKLTQTSTLAAIDGLLRRHELLDCFEVNLKPHELPAPARPLLQVELRLDEQRWAARRRYDGFSVLVAHPELAHTPEELCQLYRAKDAVEKDFKAIKGLLQVRPVHHREDHKVRAHVTICMLALLLERTLDQRLGDLATAEAAIEILEGCRLNRYAASGTPTYSVTAADPEQAAILRRLRMLPLADDDEIADRITPR